MMFSKSEISYLSGFPFLFCVYFSRCMISIDCLVNHYDRLICKREKACFLLKKGSLQ